MASAHQHSSCVVVSPVAGRRKNQFIFDRQRRPGMRRGRAANRMSSVASTRFARTRRRRRRRKINSPRSSRNFAAIQLKENGDHWRVVRGPVRGLLLPLVIIDNICQKGGKPTGRWPKKLGNNRPLKPAFSERSRRTVKRAAHGQVALCFKEPAYGVKL